MTVAYTVTPENLMLALEEDQADYIDELAGWTEEEFLRVVELVFGLQPSSLNKVMVTATLTLLNTSSPSTSFPQAKSNWTMKSCSRKFTTLFIEKMQMVEQKIPHR
jgi:hypothetical protein